MVRETITKGYWDAELGKDISTEEVKEYAIPERKVAGKEATEKKRQERLKELSPKADIKPHFEVLGDAYEKFEVYKGVKRRILVLGKKSSSKAKSDDTVGGAEVKFEKKNNL